ncbi:hypothetical protein CNMCM5793_002346 [Aspergillus hiratsukae]|uniref:CPAF-like PDZ domain-containing protein n=1 Tax=Aspergillus hiratsukae TaxID=1194566 RepID=A0A8H6UHN5_9EURO|nr:hypothetical protein CNMCM5793_002346 [Aspergillus hiratsukae]KAF7172314.1 hypothetical protein CNMCM6106_006556 [Aspergillus hiratsukae]
MGGIIDVLLLILTQALVVAPLQQPSASSVAPASAPNPTVCGDIVNQESNILNATQAYDCLTSVPFNPAVATRLVQYVNDTIQFHSTLAYLANPPPGYQQPAVDLLAGLSQIQRDIDNSVFRNEYAFEAAVKRLLNAAHDDHLSMTGGILSAFVYGAPYDIVSVSLDGIELPKVYISADLFANETEILSWQPSAIAAINGQEVVEYLTQFAALNSVGKLEPHADWNMLMRSGALDTQGYLEVFYGGAPFYPGDSITFTFVNGTVLGPMPWQAVYLSPGDTGPLQTGGDFYNFFVLGLYPASYEESLQESTPTTSVPPGIPPSATPARDSIGWWDTAYPSSADVIQQGEGLLRGYFLNESSLAVLSIPQFAAYGNKAHGFVQTVKEFLARSKEAGLKKVVIDVQQNMGGQPLLAIETFKLFFPSIEPFAGSRRRAHPMADALGATLTPYWENLTTNQGLYYRLLTNEWVVTSRLDADTGREFTSWDDYFGPAAAYDGDEFTKTERYNLTSTAFSKEAASIAIDGLGGSPQPYSPDDIIILSDGLCSSACALFMELMHHEAQVRTVVAGGRPNYEPMQAPSGTRGAAIYDIERMDQDIALARRIDNTTRGVLPNRRLDFFISAASVNLRDQVRRNDTSNTPLQFLYEAADCRIFFTPKTWYNYTNLWNYAADAAWRDPALCVANSTTSYPQPPDPLPSTSYQLHNAENSPTHWPDEVHHDYIDDPSNDILAGSSPIESSTGVECDCDYQCGGLFVCREVSVCQKGEVVPRKQCVPPCEKGPSRHLNCNSGWCHVTDTTYRIGKKTGRQNYIGSGYCEPEFPFRCPETDDDFDDLDDLDDDPCFQELDGLNLHCFPAFPYSGPFQRCYVLGEHHPRYCRKKRLFAWRKEKAYCNESDDYAGVCHCKEPDGNGPVVDFHSDGEYEFMEDNGLL